jgi:hypothetical protein
MQEIHVTMLGPAAVGKTSLLATMYERFKENVFEGGLRLHADPKTTGLLNKRLRELSNLPFKLTTTNSGGIQSTPDHQDYAFQIGKSDDEYALGVTFHDYPGSFIYDQPDFVREKLQESDAVLVAIDTPALMEDGGKWPRLHKDHNNPHGVEDLFFNAYKNLDSERLVLFVPVRCERYVQNPSDAVALVSKVKQGYAGAFTILGEASREKKVAVVIAPAQTVGSVVFSGIEDDKESELGHRFVFKPTGPDAVFEPSDTEQPLRYLLRFMMSQHLEGQRRGGFFDSLIEAMYDDESEEEKREVKRGFWGSWLGELADTFMGRDSFRYALTTFASGSKDSTPFEIVQGKELL